MGTTTGLKMMIEDFLLKEVIKLKMDKMEVMDLKSEGYWEGEWRPLRNTTSSWNDSDGSWFGMISVCDR